MLITKLMLYEYIYNSITHTKIQNRKDYNNYTEKTLKKFVVYVLFDLGPYNV